MLKVNGKNLLSQNAKALGLGQDSALQYQIEKAVETLYSTKKLAKDERIGLTVIDTFTGNTIASHKSDEMFQAASMIKLFIGLAALIVKEEGGLKAAKNTIDPLLESIFKISDNEAANKLMLTLGGPAQVREIIARKHPQISSVIINDYIPRGGAIYTNFASPSAYSKLLLELCKNSCSFSNEFLDLISLNQRSRLHGTRTKNVVPNDIAVYHKTGSTSRCCGEVGIICPKKSPIKEPSIIVAVIIDRVTPALHYESWIDFRAPIIGSIAAAAYSFFAPRYDFPKGRNELSAFDWFR